MLNRRFLRIKALQRIYAHQISKEAYQDSALHDIEFLLNKRYLVLERERRKQLERLFAENKVAEEAEEAEKRVKEAEERLKEAENSIVEEKQGEEQEKQGEEQEKREDEQGEWEDEQEDWDSENEEWEDDIEVYAMEEKEEEEMTEEKSLLLKQISQAKKLFLEHFEEALLPSDESFADLPTSPPKKEIKSDEDNFIELKASFIQEVLSNNIRIYQERVAENFHHQKLEIKEIPSKIFKNCWGILSVFFAIKVFTEKKNLRVKRFLDAEFKNLKTLKHLEKNKDFQLNISKKWSSWENKKSIIYQLYQEIFNSEIWNDYLKIKEKSKEDEIAMLIKILREKILQNETFCKEVETWNDAWEEDKKVVLSMIKRMLKAIDFDNSEIELPILSYNWEENNDFLQYMWNHTIENSVPFDKLIKEHSKNWDLERIAKVDLIILEMAIVEMLNYPNIPVKVTINEYIEISKLYSTPNSSVFVNGVLDSISKKLIETGELKKSGRGLLDNR